MTSSVQVIKEKTIKGKRSQKTCQTSHVSTIYIYFAKSILPKTTPCITQDTSFKAREKLCKIFRLDVKVIVKLLFFRVFFSDVLLKLYAGKRFC